MWAWLNEARDIAEALLAQGRLGGAAGGELADGQIGRHQRGQRLDLGDDEGGGVLSGIGHSAKTAAIGSPT